MSRLFVKKLPLGSSVMLVLFVGVLLSAVAVASSGHRNCQLLMTRALGHAFSLMGH